MNINNFRMEIFKEIYTLEDNNYIENIIKSVDIDTINSIFINYYNLNIKVYNTKSIKVTNRLNYIVYTKKETIN